MRAARSRVSNVNVLVLAPTRVLDLFAAAQARFWQATADAHFHGRSSTRAPDDLSSVAGQLTSTASMSREIWTVSPITTPPPSSGSSVSMPKSLRLIFVVADKPTRVPP